MFVGVTATHLGQRVSSTESIMSKFLFISNKDNRKSRSHFTKLVITTQKMKLPIKDAFSKCDLLVIWYKNLLR